MSTAILSPISPSSIRRRNALVPLPLLPPVPRNAIVTSVKIVHNPTPPSPTSPTDSSDSSSTSASSPEEEPKASENTERKAVKRSSTSPTSPTQTNFYFAPLAKRPRLRRRSGSRSPKCSPPTSPTSASGNRQYFPMVAEPIKPSVPKAIKEEEEKTEEHTDATEAAAAALRRPRSTILVTVRLASPPAQSAESNPFDTLPPPPPSAPSVPAIPTLRHKKPLASLAARKPRLLSLQNRPQHNRGASSPTLSRMRSPTSAFPSAGAGFGRQRVNSLLPPPPPPPVPVKPHWNKPRVSSRLATSIPIVARYEDFESEPREVEQASMPSLYPATSILRNASSLNLTTLRPVVPLAKKTKKGKTGSRLAMLRWALLNHSGPEVGRRIQAMGVRLAKEIWEAERFAEEEDNNNEAVMLGRGTRQMSGVIVASPTRETEMVMESATQDEESVLPSLSDEEEEDTMPDIESLGLASETESEAEEMERIAEECIRQLEEEMENEDIDMEVDEQEQTEMVNSTVSDITQGNADEGRALAVEAEDMEAKAEVSIKEDSPIVEDVEMLDLKEEESTPSLTSRTTSPPTQATFQSERRASLATDKFTSPFQGDKLAELNGNHMRRRSSLGLSEDKVPMVIAARKWFGKTAL